MPVLTKRQLTPARPLLSKEKRQPATRSCGPCSASPCSRSYTNCFCRTIKYYPMRSVGWNRMRLLVGSVGHEHQYDVTPSYVVLNGTLAYNSSYKTEQILYNLFGCDMVHITPDGSNFLQACNGEHAHNIVIQGSDYQEVWGTCGGDRNANAWLADYFYLPPSYQGYVTLEPQVASWLMPLEFYIGIDSLYPGLYLRVYGTLTHTSWRANFSEKLIDTNQTAHGYPAGYFSTAAIPDSNLLQTFESYIGGSIPNTCQLSNAIDKEIIFQPLNYSRISRSTRGKTAFADLAIDLGADIVQESMHYLGIYLRGVAPTSPKRDPSYLFEPTIGNGGHWEAGGGIVLSRILWQTENGESHLGFYLDGMVSYILPSRQQRTFDLKLRPNSAYTLAARFESNGQVANPEGGTFPAIGASTSADPDNASSPGHQFALEYAPVANLTTIRANVNSDPVVDLAAMLNLSSYGWSFDLGYNFWARFGEAMINPTLSTTTTDGTTSTTSSASNDLYNAQALTNLSQQWTLKGDARMFGFAGPATPEQPTEGTPVPLSATQGLVQDYDNIGSTIQNGLNKIVLKSTTVCGETDINDKVDNANLASIVSNPSETQPVGQLLMNCPALNYQIKTSFPMRQLLPDDIDFVTTKSMSHRFFAHIHHTRDKGDNFTVHGGIGGFVELGMNDNASPRSGLVEMNDLAGNTTFGIGEKIRVALTQWGVWFKCGITFNGFEPTNKEILTPNRKNVDEALKRAQLV